jgi:hypothetical protein
MPKISKSQKQTKHLDHPPLGNECTNFCLKCWVFPQHKIHIVNLNAVLGRVTVCNNSYNTDLFKGLSVACELCQRPRDMPRPHHLLVKGYNETHARLPLLCVT